MPLLAQGEIDAAIALILISAVVIAIVAWVRIGQVSEILKADRSMREKQSRRDLFRAFKQAGGVDAGRARADEAEDE